MTLPRLLVITDRTLSRSGVEQVAEEVARAGGWLLLRDKDLAGEERRQLAHRLRRITREHGTGFSVSADIALAGEVDADGVHLQELPAIPVARAALRAGSWIGFSAHSIADVAAAQSAGADYVTLSPIYETPSKPGYGPARGTDFVRQAAGLGLPVFALAGLTPERAVECRLAGAYGVAVMGGIMCSENPGAEVGLYLEALGR